MSAQPPPVTVQTKGGRVLFWMGAVVAAVAASLLFFFNPAEHAFYPRCLMKLSTGLDCPGCGMQRSFVALLKGNVMESFLLYPALVPVLLTLLLTAIHLKFRLRNGAAYVKYSYIFTVTVVMVSYIIKMIS